MTVPMVTTEFHQPFDERAFVPKPFPLLFSETLNEPIRYGYRAVFQKLAGLAVLFHKTDVKPATSRVFPQYVNGKPVLVVAMLVATILGVVPAGISLAYQSMPTGIVVYTVSTLPVSVPRGLTAITTVIPLDRVLAIEERLSEGLDQVPEHRRNTVAESRLSLALQQELKNTWEALFRIRRDRITHLPAIVFDDQAVWYGSDFRRAVTRYRNLKNAEGGS